MIVEMWGRAHRFAAGTRLGCVHYVWPTLLQSATGASDYIRKTPTNRDWGDDNGSSWEIQRDCNAGSLAQGIILKFCGPMRKGKREAETEKERKKKREKYVNINLAYRRECIIERKYPRPIPVGKEN